MTAPPGKQKRKRRSNFGQNSLGEFYRGGAGAGPPLGGEQEGAKQVLALPQAGAFLSLMVGCALNRTDRILPGASDLHIPLLWPEEERRCRGVALGAAVGLP